MRAVIDLDITYKTKFGCEFKIVEYRNAKEVLIKFLDKFGAEFVVEAAQIKRKNIVNPYQPTVLGVGWVGQGSYKTRDSQNSMSKSYQHWFAMLNRCYGDGCNGVSSGAYVCDEWLDFQVFAEWITQQDGYENTGWVLDKDLLVKGNKLYSPSTCALIPREVNNFTNKRQSLRGEFPIGVSFVKSKGKYVAQGNFTGFRKKHIGTFDTPAEAFSAYKKCKEDHAKFLAKEFAEVLDHRVIKALTEYEVDIND